MKEFKSTNARRESIALLGGQCYSQAEITGDSKQLNGLAKNVKLKELFHLIPQILGNPKIMCHPRQSPKHYEAFKTKLN